MPLAIPNELALVGAVVHQQVVPLALDLAGNLAAVTATNRLTWTVGAF